LENSTAFSTNMYLFSNRGHIHFSQYYNVTPSVETLALNNLRTICEVLPPTICVQWSKMIKECIIWTIWEPRMHLTAVSKKADQLNNLVTQQWLNFHVYVFILTLFWELSAQTVTETMANESICPVPWSVKRAIRSCRLVGDLESLPPRWLFRESIHIWLVRRGEGKCIR
jgi:hypothetical protein